MSELRTLFLGELTETEADSKKIRSGNPCSFCIKHRIPDKKHSLPGISQAEFLSGLVDQVRLGSPAFQIGTDHFKYIFRQSEMIDHKLSKITALHCRYS